MADLRHSCETDYEKMGWPEGFPPLVVLYEHPHWFTPLFDALEGRGIPYRKLHVNDIVATSGEVDAAASTLDSFPAGTIMFNRMSVLPYDRASGISLPLFVANFLKMAELREVTVVNGSACYTAGLSKAVQHALIEKGTGSVPKSVVVRRKEDLLSLSKSLEFPLLLKPNLGGSGADIRKWGTLEELQKSVEEKNISFGLDGIGILQEYHEPEDGCLYRVEMLNGKLLYGLKVPVTAGSFNYCPADGCAAGGSSNVMKTFVPDSFIEHVCKNVLGSSECTLGSVEFLKSKRDGSVYYFDVNPLSNFVKDWAGILKENPYQLLLQFFAEMALEMSEELKS